MKPDPIYGIQAANASLKCGMPAARCKEMLDAGYYLETYENEETGVVSYIWQKRARVTTPVYEYKDYKPTF